MCVGRWGFLKLHLPLPPLLPLLWRHLHSLMMGGRTPPGVVSHWQLWSGCGSGTGDVERGSGWEGNMVNVC